MRGVFVPFVATLVVGVAATAVLGAFAFGGYRLFSSDEAVPETPPPVPLVAAEPAATPPVVIEAPAVAKPATAPVVVAKKSPAPVEVPPAKLPITGNRHDSQNVILLAMAQHLHQSAYRNFVRQPGFGRMRMDPLMTVVPRVWKTPQWTSEELSREQPPEKGAQDFPVLHRLGMRVFTESNTLSSSERIAEYQRNPPPPLANEWQIKSLDLIGLAMHEAPVVYVSETVVSMKDLAKTPKREMDVFEMEGLEELMNGKDLYVRSKEGVIRVLGPVKATSACLRCHRDAKEGDMLGAFSYTLAQGGYTTRSPGRQFNSAEKSKISPIGPRAK